MDGLVRNQQTVLDLGYLSCIAIVLCVVATVCAFNAAFARQQCAWLLALSSVGFYAFLVTHNLYPMIELIWGSQHCHKHTLSLLFCSVFVFAPTVYFYAMYIKKRILNRPYEEDIVFPVVFE